MPWEIQLRAGIYLPQIDWWLDAHFPVRRSFVSHAHSDHTAQHREIVCSPGTCRLMRARVPGERCEHVLEFGQTEQLAEDTSITLYPAGHIYGSAQSLLAHPERGTLLYTGDFKLRPGRSAEPCATPHADTVIMETTYGRPHYVFPPTDQVLGDIVRFCLQSLDDGETPVLFGYSLGKSQELLSSLSAAKLPILLHPQTVKMTRVYEELGVQFPPYEPFSEEALPGHVVICPPQAGQSAFLKRIPKRRCAVITGWAMDPGATYRYGCDAAFPMSDHADFSDLLRFVELVKPERVLTVHGFAAEFARTLRERGVEAWALGIDNQLELAISASATTSILLPAQVAEAGPDCGGTCESLDHFAGIAERIKGTPRKLEKIELLRAYFSSLDDVAMPIAALAFTGRPFPQSDSRTLNLGWSIIRRAVLDATGLNESDFRQTYLRFSDSGDTAEALLTGRTHPESFTLLELQQLLSELAASRGPAAKLGALRDRLLRLSPLAAKYLIKIITGDLRIGLKEGLVEEAVAAATSQPAEAVREANMLCGDLSAVARAARAGTLGEIAMRVFHPVQFMLASPEPTAEAILERLGAPVWLEEKYDGIRCQLHKQGDRVELYSRDLHRITEQFPELVFSLRALPHDVIVDGELLAWREGRALPFAELQKRLGRKGGDDFFLGEEIPVSISCYDLLWRDGRPLLKEPLSSRRQLLEELFPSPVASLVLAPRSSVSTAVDIEAAFLAARHRGNEGLMAKDPRSPYTPGRRGLAWLKLKKAYATLDVVVIGVEYGHGKRRGVLSDYTFAVKDENTGELLTVGKAYSGLTDAEIAAMTQFFLEHTVQDFGRYRAVVPQVVLEVAFDSIQPSDRHASGYALRFPRIARIRTDKTVADIDTLETCRRLAAGSDFTHAPFAQ
ncbi:DNA ligase [Opitutaceae bacterium EW11]|nr:DNA ligase [Opitutaceae bacterium EW11]